MSTRKITPEHITFFEADTRDLDLGALEVLVQEAVQAILNEVDGPDDHKVLDVELEQKRQTDGGGVVGRIRWLRSETIQG